MCIPVSVVTQEMADGDAVAYYNRGLAHYRDGSAFTPEGIASLQSAIADFNHAIESNPDFVAAYYMRGIATIQFIHFYYRPFTEEQEKMFGNALTDFEHALQQDKSFYIAYAGMGNAMDRYGKFNDAIKWYDKALENEEEIKSQWGSDATGAIYFSRGRAYHRTLKYRAIDDYERAVEYAPNLENALTHLAVAYLQAERYEDAYNMANKSVNAIEAKDEKAPWDYRAYITRAKIHLKFERYRECMDDLKTALEIAPFTDPEILLLIGITHRRMDDADTARDYFDKAIEASNELIETPNPMRPVYTVYNTRGVVFIEIGEYRRAIEDFTKSVELAPEEYPHAHTHYRTEGLKNIGLAYLKMGDTEKATKFIKKAFDKAEEHGLEFAKGEIQRILEEQKWI